MQTEKSQEYNDGKYLLTQGVLAERWLVSPKKLESDRYTGKGCPFIKIGSSVRYRLVDVLAYEEANLRRSTSDVGGSTR